MNSTNYKTNYKSPCFAVSPINPLRSISSVSSSYATTTSRRDATNLSLPKKEDVPIIRILLSAFRNPTWMMHVAMNTFQKFFYVGEANLAIGVNSWHSSNNQSKSRHLQKKEK